MGGPGTTAPAVTAIRQSLAQRRAEAVAAFESDRQPARLLARLVRATDESLRELWQVCALPPGTAMVTPEERRAEMLRRYRGVKARFHL